MTKVEVKTVHISRTEGRSVHYEVIVVVTGEGIRGEFAVDISRTQRRYERDTSRHFTIVELSKDAFTKIRGFCESLLKSGEPSTQN